MGGFFGVASENDCVTDVFFGTDYHSHLGTKRGGMCIYGENGFQRSIHNIENSPFRTKFQYDVEDMCGNLGIGCISDSDPQPLTVRSHLGHFAITTVGRINNMDELLENAYEFGTPQFLEMSGGAVNATELTAALINTKDTLADGIRYAQSVIDGSMSILILTKDGLYAARDRMGRTPIAVGQKEDAFCASFECFAYLNLGYHHYKELGPGEIVFINSKGVEVVQKPFNEMKMCAFLWAYFGYPPSSYEGMDVEQMRYNCGKLMAQRDGEIDADSVAGVPDSGTPAAIGYANESNLPFSRPFIKYTPTWPRSFMPPKQVQRNLIAHMKLIPVDSLIRGKKLVLIDDSIVRGTQLRETTEFLYDSGAEELHIRVASPPNMFGCKYLNFSRSTSDMDLITRRTIVKLEGKEPDEETLAKYSDPDSEEYKNMLEEIRKELKFTSLRYNRLDDLIKATGIDRCRLCTYCWDGKE